MPFVVDASVAIAWAFNERHPIAAHARARIRTEEAIVPALWWYELRNVLVLGERRGRLTERDTARFLRDMSRLAISMDSSPVELQVQALARRHRLTVYDAAYLELALRRDLPLATLDGALADAARAEGVTLVGRSTG
jgi:predicted nucleic acid-binding protein